MSDHLWSFRTPSGESLPIECFWQTADYVNGATYHRRTAKNDIEGTSPHGIPLIVSALAVPDCGWTFLRWDMEVRDIGRGTVLWSGTSSENPCRIMYNTGQAPDGAQLYIEAAAAYSFSGSGKIMTAAGKY